MQRSGPLGCYGYYAKTPSVCRHDYFPLTILLIVLILVLLAPCHWPHAELGDHPSGGIGLIVLILIIILYVGHLTPPKRRGTLVLPDRHCPPCWSLRELPVDVPGNLIGGTSVKFGNTVYAKRSSSWRCKRLFPVRWSRSDRVGFTIGMEGIASWTAPAE